MVLRIICDLLPCTNIQTAIEQRIDRSDIRRIVIFIGHDKAPARTAQGRRFFAFFARDRNARYRFNLKSFDQRRTAEVSGIDTSTDTVLQNRPTDHENRNNSKYC